MVTLRMEVPYFVLICVISFSSCTEAVFNCSNYNETLSPGCQCKQDQLTCDTVVIKYSLNKDDEYLGDGCITIDCTRAETLKQCSDQIPDIYFMDDDLTQLEIDFFLILHNAITDDDIPYSEIISKFNSEQITAPNKENIKPLKHSNGLILSTGNSFNFYAWIQTHESFSLIHWFNINSGGSGRSGGDEFQADPIPIKYMELNSLPSMPINYVFNRFYNIEKLTISNFNNMQLTPYQFNALKKLKILKLIKNNITTEIVHDALHSLLNLESVIMIKNTFSAFPGNIFKYNKALKNVKLTHNDVQNKNLPNHFLSDLPNLENVDLSHSSLQQLPSDTFHNCTKLISINLSNNRLRVFSCDVLKDALNLIKLDLSFNFQYQWSHCFKNMKSLEELNLSNNLLMHIEPLSDMPKLGNIDASHNQLICNSEYSPFYELENLTSLNLSHNNITDFIYWSRSEELRTLNLSYNNIQFLEVKELSRDIYIKSEQITIDLRNNAIETIQNVDTIESFESINSAKRLFLLDSNPFLCDCNISPLISYLKEFRGLSQRSNFDISIGNAQCAAPQEKIGIPLLSLDEAELACDLDPKMYECTENCICLYNTHDNSVIINCENKSLDEVPKVPDRKLYLTDGYANAYELHFQGNNLAQLPANAIPENITVIDIRNNKLETISDEVFSDITGKANLKSFFLSGNPFSCSCNNVDFISNLQRNHPKISDYESINCADGTLISDVTLTSLCLTTAILAGAGVAFAGLLIAAIICYIFYRRMKRSKMIKNEYNGQ